LAAVLLWTSTLQKFTLRPQEEDASGRWLSPIFLSVKTDSTLKSLTVNISDEFGEPLVMASQRTKNSTLEELILDGMIRSDDDGAISARSALSFLRTTSVLARNESHFTAFRLEAAKMLENTFLESHIIIRK
jgi:hypothetical protein